VPAAAAAPPAPPISSDLSLSLSLSPLAAALMSWPRAPEPRRGGVECALMERTRRRRLPVPPRACPETGGVRVYLKAEQR
jgi:hypothetical protein